MSDPLFDQIISPKNLQEAYFSVAEKLADGGRNRFFAGIDGIYLDRTASNILQFLTEIKADLLHNRPVRPIRRYEIPKKTHGTRIVYHFAMHDRVRSAAINQVLGPIFEAHYSPSLYSYRADAPHTKAVRTVRRRVLRTAKPVSMYRADVANYIHTINLEKLWKKLEAMPLSPRVLEALRPFVFPPQFEIPLINTTVGILQGVGIVAHFSNLYLTDLDHQLTHMVELYRRVGDDLLLMEPDEQKLNVAIAHTHSYLAAHDLSIQTEKSVKTTTHGHFDFCGYVFENQRTLINNRSVARHINAWKRHLRYNPNQTENGRKNQLIKEWLSVQQGLLVKWGALLKGYSLANDDEQMKQISLAFARHVTKFLYGKYTHKNHKNAQEIIHQLGLPSFYTLFSHVHRKGLAPERAPLWGAQRAARRRPKNTV